jgi:hypothetical protein
MVAVGGNEVDADLVVHVQKSHFLTGASSDVYSDSSTTYANDNRPYPTAGKKFQFCGRTFKVEAVEDLVPSAPNGVVKIVAIHWAS